MQLISCFHAIAQWKFSIVNSFLFPLKTFQGLMTFSNLKFWFGALEALTETYGKNGLMKSKTYWTKFFRFGMLLSELRRGKIQLGTLQVLVALSTFIFLFSSSEADSNGYITMHLKIERKFRFLTVKFWGLVGDTIFWSFCSFLPTSSDIQDEKKRAFIIRCSETQGANAPSPGAPFSWLAEPPLKYEVVLPESPLIFQPFSYFVFC